MRRQQGVEPNGTGNPLMQRNFNRGGFVPADAAYVCTEHAARYCSVSRRTLEDYRYRGTGPRYRKIGRVIRYAIADLDTWMEGGDGDEGSTSQRTRHGDALAA